MQSQQLEVLGADPAKSRDQIKQDFDRLSNNRLGTILKKANSNTLNSMKFAHYLPVYEELFSKLNVGSVKMLEVGIQHGGSYRLWSNFFGRELLDWTGLDIDRRCEALNDRLDEMQGKVLIGSQSDPRFLSKVITERGPFDVVIDDGSHRSDDIIAAFQVLSSAVKPGGFYVIEDVHACYWDGFRGEGGFSNAVSYFQGLVHSLNQFAVRHARVSSALSSDERVAAPSTIRRIDFHPSMIVCEMGELDPLIEWKAGAKSILAK